MKYCMLLLWLFMASSVQAQVVPTSLAGIVLGADISTAHQFCNMDTEIPLAQERHLKEMNLLPQFVPGIKSGAVAYSNCSQSGGSCASSSSSTMTPELFRRTAAALQGTFRPPQEWRGDPFQTVMSWKWSFDDKKGQRVIWN
jgi:hypothetical protein